MPQTRDPCLRVRRTRWRARRSKPSVARECPLKGGTRVRGATRPENVVVEVGVEVQTSIRIRLRVAIDAIHIARGDARPGRVVEVRRSYRVDETNPRGARRIERGEDVP